MREITRYLNRKLYDTRTRGYITLQGVAQAVAKGEAVSVRDRNGGADITGQTLLLAMMEWEKRKRGTFSAASLSALIKGARKGGGKRKR